MNAKTALKALWLPALIAACTPASTTNPTPPDVAHTTPADSTSSPPPPPPPPSATTAPAPSATPVPEPATNIPDKLVGTWQSPSCGKRKYVRTIEFNAEAKFHGQDLVSPCPKGMQCIWSGIIDINGTFEVQADKINLKIGEPSGRPGVGEPFPTTLAMDKATSAPIEALQDGTRCVYTRAAGTNGPK